MIRKPQSRRGVVILVVLSLLVLFVLLVVTYAIIAGQYRRAAQAYARKEWLGEDPQKIVDRVMYALVREPRMDQNNSPFRGHSLLGDVYGDSIRGAVSVAATSLAGGQILEFSDRSSTTSAAKLRDLSGFYNGSVLTFSSGALQGTSTRVVGYRYGQQPNPDPMQPADHVYTFRIMRPVVSGPTPLSPSVGDTFVLNGKPFVGTGFGYVGATAGSPRLSVEALKPNRAGDTQATFTSFVTGGANESYDAPDYQNMIMAAVTANGVLPSFHRPELIRYWIDRDSGTSDPDGWNKLDADYTGRPAISPTDSPVNVYTALTSNNLTLRGRIVFRPMPWDHPNFTGSNPAFDPYIRTAEEIDIALTSGPWDIDNDGDGVKDSIWIDPDLPVQTTEDGRTYKPLVAVLCVDLDGRLNVNAHGHYGHLAGVMAGYPLPQSVNFAGAVNSQAYPKGQGYGPPEVDLNKLLNDNTQYQVLLASRYGANQQPGQTGYDALMPFKFFEYPTNYFSTAYLTSFSSNMDLRGLFASGVDYRGQPLYEGMYDTSTSPTTFSDLLAESPYEFNLNKRSAADAPFTIAELEKVLRLQDFDSSSLQSRLTDASALTFLQGTTSTAQAARRAVTTDSWDIPVPGVVAPDGYDSSLPLPQTIMELLAARLSANGFSGAALDSQISRMLSPDLIMGLRMDINRPIGNGRDDNSNAVVDEAYGVLNLANMNESLGPEYARIGAAGSTTPAMAIDHDNDGVINNDQDAHLARSYLARHLYILLMLLKDPSFQYDLDGDGTATAEETAQVLAQWAVNAVDFRDADSIMTAFEYDVNPFNGWDVDGNILTDDGMHVDRRVVWGCERPELLITETLAIHDVRTEDLNSDETGKKTTDPDPDNDFDQRLVPRGSLFIKLYNPWAGHDKAPGEFYHNGTNWNSGVLLNRTNSAGQPVWRLAITDSIAADALHPDPQSLAIAAPERSVYFANPSGLSADIPLAPNMHFTNVTGIAPLLPGRYAVVGSGGVTLNGKYVTTIGRRTDATEGGSLGLDKTRQIVLNPNVDPNVNQVEVRNNVTPPANQADPLTVDSPQPPAIQPAIAIPINLIPTGTGNKGKGKGKGIGGPPPEEINLSISEPIGGYTDENFDLALADGEGAYNPPFDEPLDAPMPWGQLPSDSTQPDYRRIHLQRLANPLARYHAVANPYLTIDVMPVDLTVFNGVENSGGDTTFGTFQRGADEGGERRLWHQPTTTQNPPQSAPPGDGGVHEFGFQLRHAFAYMNGSYGTGFTDGNAPAAPPFAVTSYVGAPDSSTFPFSWLTWNNRPYASPTELLVVPRSSSARLLRDFSLADSSVSPYDATGLGRFQHLLNFFAADPTTNAAPNLYRVFEYLTVRPRFAGTETLLNPSVFAVQSTDTEMLHPPFNWISTYREPGRINLNTIYDSRVWDALWGDHPQVINFDTFIETRRGYGTGNNLFLRNTTFPTFFANLYRAPGTARLVPDATMVRLETDATLLGARQDNAAVPRFMNDFTAPTDLARNSDRNAFFSYQGMQRLSNLVTTRSNVYALWITIGYFEYEFSSANNRWELGQEVGLDTGTVTRNRAFYIIDRSIPVAFDPGQNHNVDKCVLVRRFIE